MTEINYGLPYEVDGNCLYLVTKGKQGLIRQRLCNFLPYMISQVTKNDGEETTAYMTLGGIHESGQELPAITIPVEELASTNWHLQHWGAECIMFVGKNVKEHVRVAIQTTAIDAQKTTVYTFTGWRKLQDGWHYLMPGDDDITVELRGKLKSYHMDRYFSRDNDLTKAAFLLSDPPVPPKIMLPLLGHTFSSVLVEFLNKAGCSPKSITFLLGKTGCGKSTLAALMLSFFGYFTSTTMPSSFRDTANHVLSCTYTIKDALICIDDFHPGSSQEQSKMNTSAQHFMRAYGDRTGRGRLRADSTQMESRPPQGNAIITGEYAPDIGESGTARYVALEMKDGDLDLKLLSLYQQEAASGAFQRCTFAFTEWLRLKYLCSQEKEESFIAALSNRFQKYRDAFRESGIRCHGRLPEALAHMQIGLDFFLEFLFDQDVLAEATVEEFKTQHKEVLLQLAAAQSKSIDQDKPTHKFIRKLYALLESDQAHLMNRNELRDGEAHLGCGVCLGYEDDEHLYLFPELAFKVVRRFCEEQGESFAGTQKSLLKAMAEEKLILPGANQNTRPYRLGNRQKRVIFLRKDKAEAIRDAPM